jgi:hypothetical protein
MEFNTALISPNGILNLISMPQQYRFDDILNLDDNTIRAFSDILKLQEVKRYQVLYSLAINNLLIVPKLTSLQYVKNKSHILKTMDDILMSEGKIPIYNLAITGKRSDIFKMLDNMVGDKISLNHFERSFHILPNKFVGGIERTTDLPGYKAKIKSCIGSSFVLNESTLELTFNLIDEVYFSNLLKYRSKAAGKIISFRISNKMVGTAGSMNFKKEEYVITISARLVEISIDGFIDTLQHEITHLIVHLEMDRLSIDHFEPHNEFSSHGPHFKDIGMRFFGNNDRCHSLFDTPKEVVKVFNKHNLQIGSRVTFESSATKGKYANKRFYGKVIKLNDKRTRVQIEGGDGLLDVPYEMIELA